MRKIFYILILLISTGNAKAQFENKDSLIRLLSTAKEDTGKVMLLLRIADTYEANNQDSSIYYLEESKQLSGQLKFKKGLYHYYAQSAIVSYTKGNYDQALLQSNEALFAARELKDSNLIINTLANTGIVYQYLGQFDKQLDRFFTFIPGASPANRQQCIPQQDICYAGTELCDAEKYRQCFVLLYNSN